MKYTKKFLRGLSEVEVVEIANGEFGLEASVDDLKDATIEAIYAMQKTRAGQAAEKESDPEPAAEKSEDDLIWVVTQRRIGLDTRTSEVGERVQIKRKYARIHQKSGAVLIEL